MNWGSPFSMVPKPKIFYDASICIDAARGRIPAEDWLQVSKFISRSCKYYISPLTLDELLRGIHRGSLNQFQRNRRALEFLYPAHKKTFLPYPGDFVMFHVFGRRTSAGPHQTGMEKLVKVFLQSKDADELHNTRIWKGRPDTGLSELLYTSYGLSGAQSRYAADYNSHRSGVGAFDDELWMKMMLDHCKQADTPQNRELVRDYLSASRLHAKSLWELRKNKLYDFSKHASDLVDGQQLAYLADASMHFITSDRKLKSRIADSPQSARVWSWKDLTARASAG
jgi:hypothetical protein